MKGMIRKIVTRFLRWIREDVRGHDEQSLQGRAW